MKNRLIIILCCISFCSIINRNLLADEIKQENLPLNLINIIDIALQKNNNLKNSYLNVDIGKNDLDINKSIFFPDISLSGTYFYTKDIDTKYDQKTIDGSIELVYTIFSFGKRKDIFDQVKYKLNQINYENNEIVQELMYNVSKSYYNLLMLKAQKKSLIETEKTSFETYKVAELKNKLGLVVLSDKLNAKSYNFADKLKLIDVDNEIKKAKAELNFLLNLESKYNLYIEESEIKIKKNKKNFNNLLDMAIKNRNDLKNKVEERKILNKEISILYKEKLPEINTSLSYNYDEYVGIKQPSDKELSAKIQVSVPLFNGFKNVNSIKKAKNQLKQVDIEIDELKNVISKQVWEAYNNLETAEKSYYITKEIFASTKENAKLRLGMYKNGKSSILEVLEANDKLANAKYNLINTKYNWLMYRIELLKIVGVITIENINNIEEL